MQSMNILFIGNSHTYYHHMPRMLYELARSGVPDCDFRVEQCTGHGVSLAWHWKNSNTHDLIAGEKWDYVVLQERSGGTLEAGKAFQEHARLLNAKIRKRGARTVFYMTWAHLSRPDTQQIIAQVYEQIALELGAILAPVGLAWERLQKTDPNFRLHEAGGRHANPAGSYLTACVFYALLIGVSPVGLPATITIPDKPRLELEKPRALLLQQTAFETVQACPTHL
jgi:hypothetical protein